MPNETEPNPLERLGLCEVCNHVPAKYTCPKCEVKTCSLRCLNIHKKELNCSGIRDKTRFIPIRDMTSLDFHSDYAFLEECTRYVADRKRDTRKRHTRYNKSLPAHLFKLRGAAQERGTQLRFLLALFSRHAANTTFYEWKTHVIRWRVQWVFTNAGNVTFTDARCDERRTLRELLAKYVEPSSTETTTNADDATEETLASERLMHNALEFYRARGIAQMRVLLKAEGIKRSRTRFWELDVAQTLRANLAGKTIVEFPVVYVVYDDVVKEFDVIDSDEDIAGETELHQRELKTNAAAPIDGEECRTEPAAKRARRARNKAPQNLLFSTESSGENTGKPPTSDEEDSDGDNDGNETEEEDAAERSVDPAIQSFVAVDDDDEYEAAN